ncbi:alpha-protein kinase vwka [Anaeramoeba flamelloides]|uniref:Alpha-protein kinase vwka n=1 Tax=Anaeramoeba flamelloides TaxID=1746091 RepID=A0ABQ8XJN9_9EUKA|nr:alpha-protein kinase vwka [Anaeramoeba flamelloides]
MSEKPKQSKKVDNTSTPVDQEAVESIMSENSKTFTHQKNRKNNRRSSRPNKKSFSSKNKNNKKNLKKRGGFNNSTKRGNRKKKEKRKGTYKENRNKNEMETEEKENPNKPDSKIKRVPRIQKEVEARIIKFLSNTNSLKSKAIDLCFLFDTTKSMEKNKKRCVQLVNEILVKINEEFSSIRTAFVTYHDYDIQIHCTDSLDFFPSMIKKKKQEFFNSLKYHGGNDEPEAVITGLDKALELSWQSKNQILIHFLDSPCHGLQFHAKEMVDFFPNGDPISKDAKDVIKEMKKRGIKYVIYRFGKPERTDPNYQRILKLLIDPEPDSGWGKVEEVQFVCVDPKTTIDDILAPQPRVNFLTSNSKVRISKKPLGKGHFRLCYHMVDCQYGENLVCKKFIETQKTDNQIEVACFNEMVLQYLSKKLAKKFNRTLPKKSVDFVDSFVVKFPEKIGNKTANAEPYLQGNYQKYSNNGRWKNSDIINSTAQVFSHFTWYITHQKLIVVDIQGVDYFFTDPAIHFADRRTFSRSNRGMGGIKEFFDTHICSQNCYDALLTPTPWQKDYGINKETPNMTVINKDYYEMLCENIFCANKIEIPVLDFIKKKDQNKKIYCKECKTSQKNYKNMKNKKK